MNPNRRDRLLLVRIVSIAIPILIAIVLFTFAYARGESYLSNDPSSCANCHVMQTYYDGWLKGSHKSVAVCNDCHTPNGILSKYYSKTSNGISHSYAFTLNNYPDNILITKNNFEIAQETCRNCHSEITESIPGHIHKEESNCIACHGSIGHKKN